MLKLTKNTSVELNSDPSNGLFAVLIDGVRYACNTNNLKAAYPVILISDPVVYERYYIGVSKALANELLSLIEPKVA